MDLDVMYHPYDARDRLGGKLVLPLTGCAVWSQAVVADGKELAVAPPPPCSETHWKYTSS